MHGAALVAQPVATLDAFLPRRSSALARLAFLIGVKRLRVEELLQGDQKYVALHRADAARRNNALGLADRAEERLARADLALFQTAFQTFEAEAEI